MKGNIFALCIMSLCFMEFIFTMYPKNAPEYTPGIGYLEEDREALTKILEEICGDNEVRYDCGYHPAYALPPRKPMRG